MKKVKLYIIVIFNLLISFLYKVVSVYYLEDLFEYDIAEYVDGTIRFHFGIGCFSIVMNIIFVIIGIILIKRTEHSSEYKITKIIIAVIIIANFIFWTLHYLSYYFGVLTWL